MFNHADTLMELARIRQAELIEEAERERIAREMIRMQQHTQHKKWSTRLGHQLIQWGFRLLRPEPAVGIVHTNASTRNGHGSYRSGQARRRVAKPLPETTRTPLYLFTRVTNEIEIETTQFGTYYLTYYRSSHRVAALERYATEGAARAGHHKWAGKDWAKKPFSAVVLEEG